MDDKISTQDTGAGQLTPSNDSPQASRDVTTSRLFFRAMAAGGALSAGILAFVTESTFTFILVVINGVLWIGILCLDFMNWRLENRIEKRMRRRA